MKAAWIALLLVFANTALAASQNPEPQIKNGKLTTENSSSDPTPASNFTIVEQMSKAIVSGIETAEKKHEASRPSLPPDNSGWWFNFWLVIFNGLLVVTSATQAIVYIKQKGIMEKALLATETAANAAAQSAQAAMGTALPNLWLHRLGFANMGVSNLAAKFQFPNIEVSVKNYGGSAAFVQQQGIGIFWGTTLPTEPDYSERAFDVNQETVVESKGSFQLDSFRPIQMLPEDDVTAILNGRYSFWVYGYVQYADFLGDRHIRRFCKHFVMGGLNPLDYRFIDFNGNPRYTESA